MSILNKLVYGLDPQVSFFLYNRLPLFLLLTAGLFLIIYAMVASVLHAPNVAILPAMVLAASAAFLLLTSTMINFIYSNLFALGAIGTGASIGILLVIGGLILYFLMK
jgi:hypothetical protein